MTLKGLICLLVIFVLLNPCLAAEKVGVLKDVLVPEGFMVSQGEVFILEGATVFVFSLPDLSLKRRFGREGQGPGEVMITPWLSNLLYVYPHKILIDSVNKMVEYSHEGKFIKEVRRSEQYTQMLPVADYFVVRKRMQDPKEKKQFSTVNWFDPEADQTKELFRQPFPAQRGQVEMVPDAILYQVYQDKIFIEQSLKGLMIEVFDSRGASLYSIQHDYDKVPVTREKRRELEESLRLDPYMNISPDNWEQFKSQTEMIYPDSFPAIRDFFIADNKIYVQTFKRQNGKNQFIVMDLKGHILGEVYLPEVRRPGFTEQMMGTGVRLFCIDQNQYYYIVEKDEWCELHVAEIDTPEKRLPPVQISPPGNWWGASCFVFP
jgi:hypothetical protein